MKLVTQPVITPESEIRVIQNADMFGTTFFNTLLVLMLEVFKRFLLREDLI